MKLPGDTRLPYNICMDTDRGARRRNDSISDLTAMGGAIHNSVRNSEIPIPKSVSHHPIEGPRVAPSRLELLVFALYWLVNRFAVEGRIDGIENFDHVNIGIADSADLEPVAVDVENLHFVAKDIGLAQHSQLAAGAFQEFENVVDLSRVIPEFGETFSRNHGCHRAVSIMNQKR